MTGQLAIIFANVDAVGEALKRVAALNRFYSLVIQLGHGLLITRKGTLFAGFRRPGPDADAYTHIT
jgi:hypothetical protein